MTWKDEDQLWAFIKPRMRGKWWRLEASTPDGLTDVMGLWCAQTYWVELKVGKPSLEALRPSQRAFGMDCRDHRVPWYACFGWRSNAWFYDFSGLLTGQTVTPDFWAPPSILLRLPASAIERLPNVKPVREPQDH